MAGNGNICGVGVTESVCNIQQYKKLLLLATQTNKITIYNPLECKVLYKFKAIESLSC
jgi:hypothetical protein